jgi:hypothetical protein
VWQSGLLTAALERRITALSDHQNQRLMVTSVFFWRSFTSASDFANSSSIKTTWHWISAAISGMEGIVELGLS